MDFAFDPRVSDQIRIAASASPSVAEKLTSLCGGPWCELYAACKGDLVLLRTIQVAGVFFLSDQRGMRHG